LSDITERKAAEEAVRQLNASLEVQVEARTQEVRGLVTQLTMSEQAERRRISQILHDDLQQRLYSLNFYLTNLRHALDNGNRADIFTNACRNQRNRRRLHSGDPQPQCRS
jgi:signal transduction histidine kinase